MYKKVSTDLKFVDREKETEKFWKEHQIFEKSMENRKEGETYTFYDGPPTANGKMCIRDRSKRESTEGEENVVITIYYMYDLDIWKVIYLRG